MFFEFAAVRFAFGQQKTVLALESGHGCFVAMLEPSQPSDYRTRAKYNNEERHLVQRRRLREMLSNAFDLHVFETGSRCDCRPSKHGLPHFAAHELAFHARALCNVEGGLGRAGGGLGLKRTNEDDDVNRHLITPMSGS
jgi:hypothetical protein